MAGLTLYSFPGDFRALKALIAAQYNGVEINKPAFELGKDNLTPEFQAKNPVGKVPLLETPQGVIFESNAIARYVARIRRDTELTGRSFFETAQVDAWLDFAAHEVELPVSLWIFPILGYTEFRQPVHEKAVEDTHKALATLERHLLAKTFLVGEAITLADIVLVSALFYAFKLVLDGAAQATYPSVTRWFLTCVNQPQFAAVLGEVALATSVATASGAPAKAAGAKAEKKEKKAEAKKEEKKPEPKKEEKKPKKKEEDDDGGDIMDDIPKEAPKADPFAALPKTPLILDEWKRTYSNSKEDFFKSMEWFWPNLDKAGWSLWLQKYKYNDENKRDFMTSNLVSGFVQRSDEVRRYAFGVMHVLNNAAPYEVEGLWLMRGHDIKPMLDCNPDAEYYDWTMLNPDDEAVRKMVGDYWCSLETLNGKPIYDSKVFK